MNKRLKQLLKSTQMGVRQTCLLDTYNQAIYTDFAPTISTRVDASNNTYIMEVKVIGKCWESSQNGLVYSTEGVSPTIVCGSHSGVEPKIKVPQATKQGYIEVEPGGVFDAAYPDSSTRRGRVQEGGKVAPTLCTSNELCVYEGVEYKGKKFSEGSGLYTGASDRFQRSGLKDMSRCLKAGISDAGVVQNFRIRKLTPHECFRLMGVSEKILTRSKPQG